VLGSSHADADLEDEAIKEFVKSLLQKEDAKVARRKTYPSRRIRALRINKRRI